MIERLGPGSYTVGELPDRDQSRGLGEREAVDRRGAKMVVAW